MKAIFQGIFVFAASAGLVACGGSSSSGETGLLSLSVSDDPIHEIDKVCIAFKAIELKPAGDGPARRVELPEIANINLLDFQGMNAFPLLFEAEVDAGEYAWMRLIVNAIEGDNGGTGDSSESPECTGDASYIVPKGGTAHNLYIPSGAQSGLKFGGFTVLANESVDFTAEWDLMLSIAEPPGLHPDVILKPHVKLVDNNEVGALRGSVSTELANAPECAPAVYVFANSDTAGSDIGVSDRVASAMVNPVNDADPRLGFQYEIGFLLAGSYEVAFSCDELTTVDPADVTWVDAVEGNTFDIVAGGIEERNFQ